MTTTLLETELDHSLFTWTIKDFTFHSFNHTRIIRSPEFAMDLVSSTKWYLELDFLEADAEGRLIYVAVKRSFADKGPESIYAYYKLSFNAHKSNIFPEIVFDMSFVRGSGFRIEVGSVSNLVQHLPARGSFIILCEMYIMADWDQHFAEERSNSFLTNPSLLQLSVNFKDLFKCKKLSDVILRTSDGDIAAHRAVLSARSAVIACRFQNEDVKNEIIDMSYTSKGVLEKILLFMYSGNFDIQPDDIKLLFEVSDCARRLEVLHLTQVLTPNKIYALSEIHVDDCSFTWTAVDLSKPARNPKGFHRSPGFSSSNTDNEIWFLWLKASTSGEYSGVEMMAEITKLEKPIHILMGVTITNTTNTFKQTMNSCGLLNENGLLIFDSQTINIDNFRRYLLPEHDTLTVHCSLQTSVLNGNITTYTEKSVIVAETSNRLNRSLEELSYDFFRLLKSCYCTDGILISEAETRKFFIHKAFLFTRCSILGTLIIEKLEECVQQKKLEGYTVLSENAFSDIVNRFLEPEVPSLGLPIIEAEALKRIIMYVYCGQTFLWPDEEVSEQSQAVSVIQHSRQFSSEY